MEEFVSVTKANLAAIGETHVFEELTNHRQTSRETHLRQ
jgi:hypothetical protein